MRSEEFKMPALVALAISMVPLQSRAQDDLEFVFTDEQGHLVLRFVGVSPEGLSPTQRDEVVNAEFSSMVHDHLRADLRFETQVVDSAWARPIERQIRESFTKPGPEYSEVEIECRSDTCRIRIEHEIRWDIAEHQAQLDLFQLEIAEIIEANSATFDPEYLIAAYEKFQFMPHIKAYLKKR